MTQEAVTASSGDDRDRQASILGGRIQKLQKGIVNF